MLGENALTCKDTQVLLRYKDFIIIVHVTAFDDIGAFEEFSLFQIKTF